MHSARVWPPLLVLLALACSSSSSSSASASSYLDDYLFPSAKLALNKLQQSLASQPATINNLPTSNYVFVGQDATTQSATIQEAATVKSASESSATPTTTTEAIIQAEPTEQKQQEDRQTASAVEQATDDVTVLSSTQASDMDATSTSEYALEADTTPSSADPATSSTSTPASTSTSTTAPTSDADDRATATPVADASTQQPELATPSVDAKSAEEAAVREAEQEAIEAVDASINFGDPFSALTDSCYDEYGNARYCEPEFENAAFERQVDVSSECGRPPSRFCTAFLNERNEQMRNCHICDAQHPKKRHPAAYLTDLHDANAPTCWVSAPMHADTLGAAAAAAAAVVANNVSTAEHSTLRQHDNVTLTLNLDKKYEVIYVSMQFCSAKPDTLAIYKSADFGRTWTPYQLYSSLCPAAGAAAATSSRLSTAPEAQCVNTTAASANSQRIGFSTLDARASQQLDRSQALQEWVSATHIRIVLDRHHQQGAWPALQQQQASDTASVEQRRNNETAAANNNNNNNNNAASDSSLTSPSDTFNYAISDITVGARCKCNGHASRCVHSKEGRLQCDCRHNTAGRDCEKCAPFHFDRPWMRATQADASPCQRKYTHRGARCCSSSSAAAVKATRCH